MKIVLALLLLIQSNAWAQPHTKKVIVEGNGIPIVLLAGALAPMSSLSTIAKDLSEKYKVIRMEHFNIQFAAEGLLLPNNYSVQTESEGVKLTLDSLGIKEPVVLVGSSYGGLIAMDFGLRHPKQTRSLMVLEPPLLNILLRRHENVEGLQKTLELSKTLTAQAEITEDQVEAFRCLTMNCDTISVRKLPQWNGWVQQKNRMRGLSAAGEYRVNIKKMKKFKKPVLIVTGTETVAMHKRINDLLAQTFTFSKTLNIKSGHAIPSTAPKELVRAIIDFVR